jgi:hypothetical protein
MEIDDFNCTICNNLYNTKERMPHLLAKCGHTFCHQCLNKRLKENKLICPEDQLVYEDVAKIEDLPKNITVLNLMHKLMKRRMTEINDYSSAKESDFLKSKSNESSDRRKSLTLSRKVSSNVSEFSISENKREEKIFREDCSIHKRPLEIICLDHNISICTSCALFGDHKNHNLRSQDDIIKETNLKAELLIQYYEIIEKSSEVLISESTTASNSNLIEHIKNKTSLMKGKILSFFNEIRTHIDLKEKKLMQEVEGRFENVFLQKFQIYEDYKTNITKRVTSWRHT